MSATVESISINPSVERTGIGGLNEIHCEGPVDVTIAGLSLVIFTYIRERTLLEVQFMYADHSKRWFWMSELDAVQAAKQVQAAAPKVGFIAESVFHKLLADCDADIYPC